MSLQTHAATSIEEPQPQTPLDQPIQLAASVLESLRTLYPEGGTWALYQNQVFDSGNLGQILCLKVGPGCPFQVPPPHAPDGSHGLGWKYLFIGTLSPDLKLLLRKNLPSVPIEEAKDPAPEPPPSKVRSSRKRRSR